MIIEIERLGHRHASSLLVGTIDLFHHGSWFVGLIVLLFSIVFPLAKLVMLLELWKRNQSVVDDSFDANDMFNQGLVSVRPPMNDVRYFEPQHVVLDVIHDHQRHELHKRQVAENDLIHHRISQQHNARRLDDALRQGLVGFVKYAFEEPPNCIGEAQSQFQKYEFQIPDQVGFFSDLHAQYEHVQDPRRENVQ